MKPIALACLLSLTVLATDSAWAYRWYFPGAVGYGAGLATGYGGWEAVGGRLGACRGIGMTPGASYGHAMADMVRSEGMYNESTGRAMISVEEARGKYIQNEKQWTEVYMMQRRIREADKAQRIEDARAANQRFETYLASRPSNLPPRLTGSQLEPSTGKIIWPSALLQDAFAIPRGELDQLFSSRAHTGTTSDLSAEISKQVRAMRDELRNHIRDMPTQEYMAARKFLDSLNQEGQTPLI
ncbi:MAG: hypothetical protein U0872_00325 [Planctomycetaceae bacterium]